MNNIPTYLIWDFWSDVDTCYAIYEKDSDKKLYFSEAPKKKLEELKLLEKKEMKSKKFMKFIKKIFKRKDK
jgi:hypothetical protein